MTIKLIGAACIALAAGKTVQTLFLQRRREDALLRHMAAALATMAREIRWHHRPIPAILQALKQDEVVGEYFGELAILLDSKNTLQHAWNSVFNSFPIEKETVLNIRVAGDEEQLVASLENAADRLQHALELRRSKRGAQTKLCIAAAMSAAGGLILLLL